MTDVVETPGTPAPYPAPASAKPSRALGAVALVIALLPITVLVLMLLAVLVISPTIPGGLPWLGDGVIPIGLSLLYGGPVAGGIALVLGIIAVRTKRGSGLGIAAIVIGGFLVLYEGSLLVGQALMSLTYR